MFIAIYRHANQLLVETRHIGPFNSYGAALEYLGTLPPVGKRGVRYVVELESVVTTRIETDERLERRKALGHQ